MLKYLVRDRDGKEIHEGDWIISARGTSAVFVKVEYGEEFGHARISAMNPVPEYNDLTEYRASAFGLTVTTLCGVEGCLNPENHSTQKHGKEFRIGA
jgi:hypothetical protein